MTDSESEREVDENYCVAFAAETAAILAIGCVSGLKGIKKLRKGVSLFSLTHLLTSSLSQTFSLWKRNFY